MHNWTCVRRVNCLFHVDALVWHWIALYKKYFSQTKTRKLTIILHLRTSFCIKLYIQFTNVILYIHNHFNYFFFFTSEGDIEQLKSVKNTGTFLSQNFNLHGCKIFLIFSMIYWDILLQNFSSLPVYFLYVALSMKSNFFHHLLTLYVNHFQYAIKWIDVFMKL